MSTNQSPSVSQLTNNEALRLLSGGAASQIKLGGDRRPEKKKCLFDLQFLFRDPQYYYSLGEKKIKSNQIVQGETK